MSDYDNRQYRRMLDQIKDFESKRIDLEHLINGLESLLCALEEANAGWKSEFQSKWGLLEEVYAVALDRNRPLNQDDWKLINPAVERMKQLISDVYSEQPEEET
jgi:hypothetical protein